MFRNLKFGPLPRSNVLPGADKPTGNLPGIPDRRCFDPKPTDGTICADDAKLFVEASRCYSVVQSCKHMQSILGVYIILVRERIAVQGRNGPSSHGFICFVEVDDVLGLRIHHTKKFLDEVCHLLKALFALAQGEFGMSPFGRIAKYGNVASRNVVSDGCIIDENR